MRQLWEAEGIGRSELSDRLQRPPRRACRSTRWRPTRYPRR